MTYQGLVANPVRIMPVTAVHVQTVTALLTPKTLMMITDIGAESKRCYYK